MNKVTSSDGTTIAFDRLGEGPPVILVCGGSTDRSSNAPLAALLAGHFTVFNYDRRGRGDSGDTAPYAVEREVEDIDAVIDAAGGSAFVCGTSSGAALALEAAASGLTITKLALWEPPFILDESRRPPADLVERYNEMIAAGRRGDAVEYFMAKVVAFFRPSSSPTREPSRSGRPRRPWRTRSPTTPPSWETTDRAGGGRHRTHPCDRRWSELRVHGRVGGRDPPGGLSAYCCYETPLGTSGPFCVKTSRA